MSGKLYFADISGDCQMFVFRITDATLFVTQE